MRKKRLLIAVTVALGMLFLIPAAFCSLFTEFSPALLTYKGDFVRCKTVTEKPFRLALRGVLAGHNETYLCMGSRVYVLRKLNEEFELTAKYTAEALANAAASDPGFDSEKYEAEAAWGEVLWSHH